MYSVFLITCSSGRIKHNMHRNALPRSTKLYQALPSSTKHYQALSCPYPSNKGDDEFSNLMPTSADFDRMV